MRYGTTVTCPSYLYCREYEHKQADYGLKLARARFALRAIAGEIEGYQIENPEEYAKNFLEENDLRPRPMVYSFSPDEEE